MRRAASLVDAGYVRGERGSAQVVWASYGTDDCSYYDERCLESGGSYYCEQAPYWCAAFPRGEAVASLLNAWSRCTRRCLQECDRAESLTYCPAEPDGRPGPFALHGASFLCHGSCYASCIAYTAAAL